MKKRKAIIFLVLLGGIFVSPVLAAISYPEIAGITISNTTTASEYIIYFFNLAIAVGTFIAAVVIAMAGFDYVTSQGEPAKIESAKGKIRNAFLGVIILLASFLILNIINPQLTNIKINNLGKTQSTTTVVIPEGKGIYLYDSPNFSADGKSLILKETAATLAKDTFNNRVQSIKFVNPDNFKFGAVLFADLVSGKDTITGSDLRGRCSYLLSDLANMDNSSGNENNPPIGNNKLTSILIFKTTSGSASVNIYNSINCQGKTNDYCRKEDKDTPCEEDKTKVCTLSGGNGFQNIKQTCPDFKGEVLSIGTSGDVGVLFKSEDKEKEGQCQFFQSGNTNCINTVKYSYVYRQDLDIEKMLISPKSFIVFPLVK